MQIRTRFRRARAALGLNTCSSGCMSCPACGDVLDADGVIALRAACGHIFCEKCIDALITGECGCMYCGKPLMPTTHVSHIQQPTIGDAASHEDDDVHVLKTHVHAQLSAQMDFIARQIERVHAQEEHLRNIFHAKTTAAISAFESKVRERERIFEKEYEQTKRALETRAQAALAARIDLASALCTQTALQRWTPFVVPDTERPIFPSAENIQLSHCTAADARYCWPCVV